VRVGLGDGVGCVAGLLGIGDFSVVVIEIQGMYGGRDDWDEGHAYFFVVHDWNIKSRENDAQSRIYKVGGVVHSPGRERLFINTVSRTHVGKDI
jgi:hypothetical protein